MRMELTKSVLTLSLILILFPLIGHSAERDLVDADGNGLIEVYDLSDLNEIRNNLDGKALYGSSQGCPDDGCVGFELKADLDFDTNGDGIIDEQDAYWNNGAGWLPLGSSSTNQAFQAEFNGNGHVIRNLYINRPTTSYIGLFGYTDGALISRVGLAGTLSKIIGDGYVGGLVGRGSATKLQGVFSTGSVSSDSSSFAYVGGIVGYLSNGSLVEDSFSSAGVDANGNFVGGLVGYFSGSEAKRAFSVGFVRGDSSSYVGGLTGLISSSPISYSYWATDASGQSSSYGSSTSANSNYFGAALAQLRCATDVSNASCVENRTLFENWPTDAAANNGIAWVFGDGTQLPALLLNGKEYRDSDGDGFLDEDDAFPNRYAAAIDTDKDEYPDRWTLGCDIACQQNSGLILDEYLNDFDNDGVEDHLDPDLYADNGAPEMQSVPGEMHVSANETGTVALLKYSELLADLRALDAVDDYDVNFQAKIGASIVPFETVDDEKYLKVPVGRQVLAWHATDKSGNESSAKEQVMNVYPRIRFVEEESITGENSIAKVAVSLTGKSPVYPVVVKLEFVLGKSTLTQDDVDSSLKLSELQSLKFPAVSTVANLNIPVLDDDIAEEDETLLIKLLGVSEDTDKSEYFLLDPSYQLHELTVTERNLPPSLVLQLYQDEKQVEEVRSDGGEVRIEANITDPNGNDTHTISWKEKGGLPFLHTDGNVLTFDPSSLKAGSYDVEVTVTDSGNPPLSETKSITVEVLSSPGDEGEDENSGKTDEQKESATGKKKKKGGSVPVVIFAGLALAYAQRRWQKSRAAA